MPLRASPCNATSRGALSLYRGAPHFAARARRFVRVLSTPYAGEVRSETGTHVNFGTGALWENSAKTCPGGSKREKL